MTLNLKGAAAEAVFLGAGKVLTINRAFTGDPRFVYTVLTNGPDKSSSYSSIVYYAPDATTRTISVGKTLTHDVINQGSFENLSSATKTFEIAVMVPSGDVLRALNENLSSDFSRVHSIDYVNLKAQIRGSFQTSGCDDGQMVEYSPSVSTLAAPPRPIATQRISASILAAALVSRVSPEYPVSAKMAHVGGAVVLHVIVSADGSVENVEVVSGSLMLQAAAIEAVKQWRYKPYIINGTPFKIDSTVTLNFNGG